MKNTQNNINQENNDTLTIEFIIRFFKSNIPIITLYVYLIGILYILSYYRIWGVNIMQYISITETLTAPIQYIILMFMLSLFLIFSIFISSKIARKPVSIFYNIPRLIVDNRAVTVMFVFYIISMIIINIIDYNKIGVTILDGLFIIYFFSIIRIIVVKKKKEFITFIKYLSIITVLIVFFKSMQDYYNCINYLGKKENISFQYRDRIYTESDSLFSIGQTAQYIFMYNKPKDRILIFPISQLSNIEIMKIKVVK